MLKLWLYLTSILKYLLVLVIISGIIAYFFQIVGIIVFALGIIGMFGVVKDEVNIKYAKVLADREKKRIMKIAAKSKDEFEGFEMAMALTRRRMQ